MASRPPTMRDYAGAAARIAARLGPPPAGGPLVSVVTVCRNAAATIGATLSSVRVQDHPWIEHIVVDGASADGTRGILEQASGVAWISEPDLGISDAFNKGVAAARGGIIGILNADDRYLPGAVARAVACLEADPAAGWCFGGCDFSLDGRVVLHRDGDPGYARVIDRTMPVVNHPTVFVRRASYEAVGLFRTDLRLAMDYDLVLRLHRAGHRGVCIQATQAVMALGGATGRHILSAYAEAARISVEHGRGWLPAQFTRMRLSALPLARIIARRCGLGRRRHG